MLTHRDFDFLEALRRGERPRAYARRVGYSDAWAKFESRKVRRLLGAQTLEEAVSMSEVTAEDLSAIRRELRDLREAQEKLAAAKTPAAKEEAREDVREAKDDLDAELRRRGLSRADLDELQESKEYERFKARQERLEAERADGKPKPRPKPKAKAKADDDDEPDPDDDDDGPPVEQPPASNHWSEKPLWGKRGGEA